jgi:tetratricopeptide (TPR) repeat protein
MNAETASQFDRLHAAGLNANKDGEYDIAAKIFELADDLASEHNDPRKRLDALNPWAKALWSQDDYDQAIDRLELAAEIANDLDLTDEAAIAVSNIGRVAAVRVVRLLPVELVAEALHEESLPHFSLAREKLSGHPHFYYRYANAHHGAPIAAVAEGEDEAMKLIAEGAAVARKVSPEPYDQVPTYTINPNGLNQLALAIMYLEHGLQDDGLRQQIIDQIH